LKRPRPVKALRRFCCGCFLWSIFLLFLAAAWIGRQLGPVSSSRSTVRVKIPPGSSSSKVASILAEKGVIRDARIFQLFARVAGGTGNLKAGTFKLSPSMTAAEVLRQLGEGGAPPDDIAVTIPEGFRLVQIVERLKAAGIIDNPERFKRLASGLTEPFNPPFPLPRKKLEGYLYPDTYRFLPKCGEEAVIQKLLENFDRQFYSEHREEVERSGHSLHEIVTIASLIEREAQIPADRPKIAGVIENRLKQKKRLEIDATVIYALGHHVNRVFYKDLAVDSPYNTYRHAGLPPGPIASPGIASLEAALHPDRHPYLYYVAMPGGGHVFAKTKAEHDKNVARRRALLRS
jgi:UPF0755 protein